MKLHDLESNRLTENSQKVFESYFGKKINVANLSATQAGSMLSRVRNLIREHRNSTKLHTSEKNPGYLKLLVIENALRGRIQEAVSVGTTGTMGTQNASFAINMNDPKTKQIMDKATKGQTLTPEEQKTLTAVAMMQKEAKKKPGKKVMESEVQQAQVVLAAQDMVDRIQDFLEDVTEMKFKDLPALVDSIRNEVGTSQAQQYMNDANSALDALIACVQETKTQVEAAQGVLTGQEPVVPGEEEADTAPAELDLEVDTDAELDVEEPASDLEASLGRARR
jgi:uncharacterized protein (DUF2164 family)